MSRWIDGYAHIPSVKNVLVIFLVSSLRAGRGLGYPLERYFLLHLSPLSVIARICA